MYKGVNNKSCILKKNNIGIFEKDIEKEELIGVEMAHFRIVSIIQDNKKILD